MNEAVNVLRDVILPIALVLMGGTLILGLARLKPDRAKITAEAEAHNANATSVLTGAALEMVKSAMAQAHDAIEAAKAAEAKAEAAERAADECSRMVRKYERWAADNGLTLPA